MARNLVKVFININSFREVSRTRGVRLIRFIAHEIDDIINLDLRKTMKRRFIIAYSFKSIIRVDEVIRDDLRFWVAKQTVDIFVDVIRIVLITNTKTF